MTVISATVAAKAMRLCDNGQVAPIGIVTTCEDGQPLPSGPTEVFSVRGDHSDYAVLVGSGHVSLRANVVPVRISLGGPRFIAGAARFPVIVELMPAGLFHIDDREEFTRRFYERLDAIGVDAIQARFDELHDEYPGQPLVLMCFEDLTKPGEWCRGGFPPGRPPPPAKSPPDACGSATTAKSPPSGS